MFQRRRYCNSRCYAKDGLFKKQKKKENNLLKLDCALGIQAKYCFHQSIFTKSQTFTENDKQILAKPCEDMVGGPFIFLREKLLWILLLFKTQKTSATLLLEFMPVNFIPFLFVKQCAPVWIQNGTLILKLAKQNYHKIRRSALKLW